jgi:hypothetical protein
VCSADGEGVGRWEEGGWSRGGRGGREYRTFNCPTGGVGAGKL